MAKINDPAHAASEGAETHQSPATVVRGRLPTAAFALSETFSTMPELRVQCASLGATGEAAIMPLVWFQTTDDAVEPTLANDPTVAHASELVRTEERRLYRIEWSSNIRLLCRLLLSSQAVLQNASATDSHWNVEIIYPDRESLSQISGYCDQYNLSFEIESIRTLDPEQTTQYGLTSAQYEALMLAWERGYFEVPREIDLEGLAEEIGVSHHRVG